jgi:hypothetical protein
LQDTERVLQILTNALYVEKKNQLSMHRESEDGEELQDEEIKVDREGAQMYVRPDID